MDGMARAENVPVSLGMPSRRPSPLASLPPLSLYIHLPWCLRKCPYCDFNSHEFQELPEGRYLDALQADLEASLPLIWGRTVHTVFIGGGTPSLFSPESIDRLLTDVRARVKLAPDAEITLEANPGTFERERFRGFRQAGVNRLSLGIQSFDDAALVALGRVHDRHAALAAAESAAQDFDTFNLDLMYALPGQDLAGLHRDLRQALAFEPPHLSYYNLTIEPNTLFAARPPAGLPDDDQSAAMQDAIDEACAVAGLQHYEVSAFARAGHRSRHNLNYWTFGDYLGIGAGAHGKLSFHDRIIRQARWRHPQRYMEAALGAQAVEIERTLDSQDLSFEFLLNALRLLEGVPASTLSEKTGVSLASIARPIAQAVEQGLLSPDPSRLCATPLGQRFLNDLQTIFLPESDSKG